jgi:hypothetical protein
MTFLEKLNLQTEDNVSGNLLQVGNTFSDNWKSCALGERMKKEGRDLDRVKDLIPEAVKLGFDFTTAIKRRDSSAELEILEQIEKLPTIWCNPQDFQ